MRAQREISAPLFFLEIDIVVRIGIDATVSLDRAPNEGVHFGRFFDGVVVDESQVGDSAHRKHTADFALDEAGGASKHVLDFALVAIGT